jgi:hypothetical protein
VVEARQAALAVVEARRRPLAADRGARIVSRRKGIPRWMWSMPRGTTNSKGIAVVAPMATTAAHLALLRVQLRLGKGQWPSARRV